MLNRGFQPGFGGAPPPSAFELISSSPSDHEVSTADPWDATIAVPSGTQRVILDVIQPMNSATGVTDKLDPGVADDDLTQQDSITNGISRLECWRLLEAEITAAGSKNLQFDVSTAVRGFRQIIILRGAAQTISIGKITASSSSANINVSVTRASGDFPIGSKVFAFLAGDAGTQTVTVSGDAALVRTQTATGTDDASFWYAEGTLGSAKPTVTVGFDPTFNIPLRAQMVVVVEPTP